MPKDQTSFCWIGTCFPLGLSRAWGGGELLINKMEISLHCTTFCHSVCNRPLWIPLEIISSCFLRTTAPLSFLSECFKHLLQHDHPFCQKDWTIIHNIYFALWWNYKILFCPWQTIVSTLNSDTTRSKSTTVRSISRWEETGKKEHGEK